MTMTEVMGEEPEVVLAERRYAAIAKILETVVKKRRERGLLQTYWTMYFYIVCLGYRSF